MLTQHQEQQQWQDARALLAADPAYASWSDAQHAADALAFEQWLDTEEGIAWLNAELEGEAERACTAPCTTSNPIWH